MFLGGCSHGFHKELGEFVAGYVSQFCFDTSLQRCRAAVSHSYFLISLIVEMSGLFSTVLCLITVAAV